MLLDGEWLGFESNLALAIQEATIIDFPPNRRNDGTLPLAPAAIPLQAPFVKELQCPFPLS